MANQLCAFEVNIYILMSQTTAELFTLDLKKFQ